MTELHRPRARVRLTFLAGGGVVCVESRGEGTNYDHRARTATPIPAAQTQQQQFIQYHRRIPNLILGQPIINQSSLRYLGEDDFDGRKHTVITFVMPDTQQVALYFDAKTNLLSKYELIFTDPLTGEEASDVLFSDYTTIGKLKVPRKWSVPGSLDRLTELGHADRAGRSLHRSEQRCASRSAATVDARIREGAA